MHQFRKESYKGHEIKVISQRPAEAAGWIIEVHIKCPDGSYLPVIRDNDRSFSDIEGAFAAGMEIGRHLIDSN